MLDLGEAAVAAAMTGMGIVTTVGTLGATARTETMEEEEGGETETITATSEVRNRG